MPEQAKKKPTYKASSKTITKQITLQEAQKLLAKMSQPGAKGRCQLFAVYDAENPEVSVALSIGCSP